MTLSLRSTIPSPTPPRTWRGVFFVAALCAFLCSAPFRLRAQDAAAERESAIRAINKYGFLQFDGQGPKAVKTIPKEKSSKEDESWENIWENMKTSFSLPWEDFFNKEKPTDGLSGSLSVMYPLNDIASRPASGSASQGVPLSSAVVGASLTYAPVGYWFVNFSAMRYWFPDRIQPWNPDFTYSFGYNDWHPYTFSFVYQNFGGNRFNPGPNEAVTRFWEGIFSLGWKFPSAKLLEYLCVVHPSGGIGHNITVNVTPDYRTAEGRLEHWKTSVIFATKYTIYENFYLNFSIHAYPIPGQQQPWDPDFTYGFGYFDWHPYSFSLQYNNFAGGRFPWNQAGAISGDGFFDGTLTLSWSFVF